MDRAVVAHEAVNLRALVAGDRGLRGLGGNLGRPGGGGSEFQGSGQARSGDQASGQSTPEAVVG